MGKPPLLLQKQCPISSCLLISIPQSCANPHGLLTIGSSTFPDSETVWMSVVSIDFQSFATCSETFSRLLWPSDTTKTLLPQIQHVTVLPPPEFYWQNILPLLIRLSQFCEPSQSSISLALAAELVVLASSNSLETAHHRVFLFGPASAIKVEAEKNFIQIVGAPSSSVSRKRRLQESTALVSDVLMALNLAPLKFCAHIGIKDASQHARIVDAIHSINKNSANVISHIPLEVHVEAVSTFRQQVQQALAGDRTPSPLFLYLDDDSSSIEMDEENADLIIQESTSGHEPNDESASNVFFACDFRAMTSSLLHRIVAHVSSRFGSSQLDSTNSNRRSLELVCSRFLESIVFQASQKYLKYVSLPAHVEALLAAEVVVDPSHAPASCTDAHSGPIYGRHPSYRAPVPQVEVVSFEQVNPVWTHQCKPGSRICVLLRCHQRTSDVFGKH